MSSFIDKLKRLYEATAAPIDEADMLADYADMYEIVGDFCNSPKFSSTIDQLKAEVLKEIQEKMNLKATDEIRRNHDGVSTVGWLVEKMFGEYLSNNGKINE